MKLSTARKSAETAAQQDARSGTLARGLAVLDILVNAPQPLMLLEVATSARLDQSTTLRLLRTLEESRYVIRHPESKRYSPSPIALRPLPLLHPLEQLRREASPILASVSATISQTVLMVLFHGRERLALDIAQSPGSLTPYYGTWLERPVHCTAVGKAHLLSLDKAQRRAMLGPAPFPALTPHTITTEAELQADLDLSAERGYVVARDEHGIGLTAVAACITAWNGTVAGCLTATGHSRDFAGNRTPAIGEELKRAAGLLVFQAPALGPASQFCGR